MLDGLHFNGQIKQLYRDNQFHLIRCNERKQESIIARRLRRTFTEEFKTQIVNLYLGGKKKSEILRAYDLHDVTLNRWIKQHQGTGSFKEADNRTPEEKELIELRKRNQQLEMGNDILKQAALIRDKSK